MHTYTYIYNNSVWSRKIEAVAMDMFTSLALAALTLALDECLQHPPFVFVQPARSEAGSFFSSSPKTAIFFSDGRSPS